jgi:hypothetical protein
MRDFNGFSGEGKGAVLKKRYLLVLTNFASNKRNDLNPLSLRVKYATF